MPSKWASRTQDEPLEHTETRYCWCFLRYRASRWWLSFLELCSSPCCRPTDELNAMGALRGRKSEGAMCSIPEDGHCKGDQGRRRPPWSPHIPGVEAEACHSTFLLRLICLFLLTWPPGPACADPGLSTLGMVEKLQSQLLEAEAGLASNEASTAAGTGEGASSFEGSGQYALTPEEMAVNNFSPASARLTCPQHRKRLFHHLTQDAILTQSEIFTSLMDWDPPGDTYLIMDCYTGRASNRLPCIQHTILFAGLLNRTLVIDTSQLEFTVHHYNWSLLVDVAHLRQCFGPRAVTTTEEYMREHGGRRLAADAVLCWGWHCPLHWEVWGNSVVPANFTLMLRGKSYREFRDYYLKEFKHFRAIFIGDVTGSQLQFPQTASCFGDVPFRRREECRNAATLLPHARIVALARDYVADTFGGEPFLALHYRQGDFYRKCKTDQSACISMEQATKCVVQEAHATNISNILIGSDMSWRQGEELEKMLKASFQGDLKVVINPEPEDFPKELTGFAKEGFAAFQKAVMAQGLIFHMTNGSLFSLDIERMRVGLGLATCRDTYLCF